MDAPKIFISYAREDETNAVRVYRDLQRMGAEPWLDKNELVPGMEWKETIRSAIMQCDFFLALLSSRSVNKKGFVQKEVRRALDVLDELPVGKVYVIPARLEECQPLHNRLHELQWVNLFESWDDAISRIGKAVGLPASLNRDNQRRAKPTSQHNRVKIAITVPQAAIQQLDQLMTETDSASRSELFRRALAVYSLLVTESQQGRIVIRGNDGREREIVLLP